jgi:flagellin
MRIQHNIMAMNAYRNYNTNTSALSSNLEKLSSGYKINRAGDDAAGLAISEKMRAQISGLEQASSNVKDGISLVKTGEGALQEVQDMLNRMVTLATQSANGTYDDDVDRANLQKEVDALKSEIDRIADSSNFNGINLLDGSLDAGSTATTVTINGVISTKSVGAAGKYTSTAAYAGGATGMTNGDKFSFTVALNDGTSKTINFTIAASSGGTDAADLVAEDGTVYSLAAAGTIAATDFDSAVVSELKKTSLADQFNISTVTSGKVTLEATQEGTDTPVVTAFDYTWTKAGTAQAATALCATVETEARDEGREIVATDITEYDGTNYDDAVFTINGKKFVLMTKTHDGNTAGYMNATEGLGSDVTILTGGKAGLTKADKNFSQNIAKIAAATGLTVTAAVDEATQTGAAPATGIRLSKGAGTGDNGLKLQIGDTSDSYNQLKVSISDMHVDALGLGNISVADQDSASAAISAIKDAINSVSSTRGDLGAVQNRLEHTANNLSVMTENIQDAESTIRDTDIAEEMMSYTKNNILVQSAQAMLAQANSVPQGVLQLLQ